MVGVGLTPHRGLQRSTGSQSVGARDPEDPRWVRLVNLLTLLHEAFFNCTARHKEVPPPPPAAGWLIRVSVFGAPPLPVSLASFRSRLVLKGGTTATDAEVGYPPPPNLIPPWRVVLLVSVSRCHRRFDLEGC